ncbi:hypothetical protein ACPCHT_01720 [Nucisporomicrobium flavum]|uniref:hypothetical protein n=1 Tax=Nucisporomicrobium flavum TaxID=2785915 RepID=UPI0018F51BF1|nr:hypothetical protein [Nucisporomicrobium flavum]
MTEELRSLLRDELSAERPPPLGDLVGSAVRDGRRIRRRRRFAAAGGGTAVAGVLAVAVALAGPYGTAPVPDAGVVVAASPSQTLDSRIPATPEAMLVLLRNLLPPGRTSDAAKAAHSDLQVQMSLDRGQGPAIIRVSVAGYPSLPRAGKPTVTVETLPDNCTQAKVVRADWPGGMTVQADLATCRMTAGGSTPTPLALTDEEAKAVVSDPRWGDGMDPALVRAGEQDFPHLATFG